MSLLELLRFLNAPNCKGSLLLRCRSRYHLISRECFQVEKVIVVLPGTMLLTERAILPLRINLTYTIVTLATLLAAHPVIIPIPQEVNPDFLLWAVWSTNSWIKKSRIKNLY